MSIATNLVARVGVAWTFRILGFMLWAVWLPASYFVRPPSEAVEEKLELQWYPP